MSISTTGLSVTDDTLLKLGYDSEKREPETGSKALQQQTSLNRFLSGVEKRAFRMAQIATNNPEEALDIVQDTMLKLVEKYADKPEEELGPLFFCILQSKIRDWYRRSSVRNRFRTWLGGANEEDDEIDAVQLLADPAGQTPEEILVLQNSISALERALNKLPLRQQQVFLLRAWEGLDTRQTAKAMGCAEGSVKTHYSRALATLREKLGDHWQ